MRSPIIQAAQTWYQDAIVAALKRVPFTDLHQPVYHFTDWAGLQGILGTRSIWASLAMALEDTTEIRYALELARRIVEQNPARSPIFARIVPLLDPHQSETIRSLGLATYVISFRTTIDARAHWATYGRSGTGFALALGLKPLVIPGTLAFPVLYDPQEQEHLLGEFIEKAAAGLGTLSKQCPASDLEVLARCSAEFTALGVWALAPVLKDGSRFKHEEEWRIIVTDLKHVPIKYGRGMSSEVRVRKSGSRDVPYKVLNYDCLPIVSLELGPNASVNENERALVRLLRHATCGRDVPITRSRVVV
jgi:hypothetical protein